MKEVGFLVNLKIRLVFKALSTCIHILGLGTDKVLLRHRTAYMEDIFEADIPFPGHSDSN